MSTSDALGFLLMLANEGGEIVSAHDLAADEAAAARAAGRVFVTDGGPVFVLRPPRARLPVTLEQVSLLREMTDNGGKIVDVSSLSDEQIRLADVEGRLAVGHGLGIVWIPAKQTPGLTVDELSEASRRMAAGFATAFGPTPDATPSASAPPEIRMVEVYDVAAEACATWGPTAQATMIVEEVGEFLTAFARLSRDRATREQVIEEAADVIVVLGSALVLVGGKGNETLALLAEAVEGKVARLRERLARANS